MALLVRDLVYLGDIMGKVKLKLFALLAVFAITIFTPALPVLADAPDCASDPKASGCPCAGSSATICDDLKNTNGGADSDLAKIINGYIKLALIGAGVLAVIVLIYGGIKYMTSAGNKNNITSAKTVIVYGIAGLALAISAYAIVEFVVGRL